MSKEQLELRIKEIKKETRFERKEIEKLQAKIAPQMEELKNIRQELIDRVQRQIYAAHQEEAKAKRKANQAKKVPERCCKCDKEFMNVKLHQAKAHGWVKQGSSDSMGSPGRNYQKTWADIKKEEEIRAAIESASGASPLSKEDRKMSFTSGL